MRIKTVFFWLIIFAIMFPLNTANAQLGTLTPPVATTLDLNANVTRFINFAIGSGTVVFLYMFVRGAIEWTISEGDKMALQTARNRMTQAAVGLILLGICFAIANLVRMITYTKGF